MTELVDRYIHQVGRYLPKKDRADIEAELRSLIQDQLDDRFAQSPSQADVASLLIELGDPYSMAASYNRERYFVGPVIYPFLIMLLRYIWVVVPSIVIFLNLFGALVSSRTDTTLSSLLLETLGSILQAAFTLSGVAVLFFAFVERRAAEKTIKVPPFNPLELPKVDDPRSVDHFEAAFGIGIGALMTVVFLYFLQAGGLTLRFNMRTPEDVIPVPTSWLVALIVAIVAMSLLQMVVLRLNYWTPQLLLVDMMLETFGVIGLYFVVLEPLLGRLLEANPSLAEITFIHSVPEAIAVIMALIIVLSKGSKFSNLLNERTSPPAA